MHQLLALCVGAYSLALALHWLPPSGAHCWNNQQIRALFVLGVAGAFAGWALLVLQRPPSPTSLLGMGTALYLIGALAPLIWVIFASAISGRARWLSCNVGLLFCALAAVACFGLAGDWPWLGQAGAARDLYWLWGWLHAGLSLLLLATGALRICRMLWATLGTERTTLLGGAALAILPPGVGLAALPLSDALISAGLSTLACAVSAFALSVSAGPRALAPAAPPAGPAGRRSPGIQMAPPLAVMSHEMRGLLSGVVSAASMLERTALDAVQQNLVGVIRTTGSSMLDVMNSTIELAQLEAGRLVVQQSPFDLRACIEETLDVVVVEALQKRLDVAYIIDASAPERLVGDGGRLAQVLLNLVSNAVRHTERGGVLVSVSGSPEGENAVRLHITVRDTGPGIPEQMQAGLFEPFSRPPGHQAPDLGGGLGLAISRHLVALMGGSLTLQQSSAEGTSFSFSVLATRDVGPAPTLRPSGLEHKRLLLLGPPSFSRDAIAAAASHWGMLVLICERADQVAALLGPDGDCYALLVPGPLPDAGMARLAEQLAASGRIVLGRVGWLELAPPVYEPEPAASLVQLPLRHRALLTALQKLVSAPGVAVPAPADQPGPSPQPPLTVLVVDDHELSREMARQMLIALGHAAYGADSAVAALAALRERPFDLLLLDIQLSGDDGLVLAEQLLSVVSPEWRPYVAALTGERRPASSEQLRAAGIAAWLLKPLTVEELNGLIAECHSWRAQQRLDWPRTPYWEGLAREVSAAPMPGLDPLLDSHLDVSQSQIFFDQYLADTQLLVGEMRASLQGGDTQRLLRAAHKLKSSSLMVSEHRLARLCQELDSLSASRHPDDVGRYVQLIEIEYQRVRDRLMRG